MPLPASLGWHPSPTSGWMKRDFVASVEPLCMPQSQKRSSKLRTKLRLLLEGGSFGSLHLRGASKVRKKGNDTTMYSWERRRRVV